MKQSVLLRQVGSQPKMASHLHDLTQDIVAVSKWQKCGLKYVIYSLGEQKTEPMIQTPPPVINRFLL